MPSSRACRPRLRLLYVQTHPLFSQRVLTGQLAYFRECGCDVTLAASPAPELSALGEQEGVRVVPIRIPRDIEPVADAAAFVRLVRLCRRLRPHVVNASMPKAALLGLLAARLTRVPARVYVLRGLRLETTRGLQRRVLAWAERLTAACAHRVLSVSHSLRATYVEQGYAGAEKVVVLGDGSGNGVDAARFARGAGDTARVRRLRQSLGLEEKRVVGYVGRLTADKGTSDLYAAYVSLRARVPDAKLLLVGDFESGGDDLPGPLRQALVADPGVIITGVVAEPAPYYGLMEVVVLASHREGFPNVPLEAAACGIPVVGTRVTGTVDAIVDGDTGRLVDRGDVQGLAEGILGYLVDEDLRRAHGARARQRVTASFRGPVVWQALEGVYRELAAAEDTGSAPG